MRVTEHDLRTPISAIEGYARLLLREGAEGKTKARLEGILASCRILEHLIETMRLARALEADSFGTTPPGGDLAGILRRAAEGFAPAFELKRASVSVDAEETAISRGAWLAERFSTALLLAALSTSAEGRDVRLVSRRSDGEVRFSAEGEGVADPGPSGGFDLVQAAAHRLGGRFEAGTGRILLALPEAVLV